jgi:tetratricopeptide (TPR) repeat protein
MGLTLLKLRRWDLALDSFQDSLRIKPEQMECHFGLGLILEERGDWQEAMREYEAALKIQPANRALQQYVDKFQTRLNSHSTAKQSGISGQDHALDLALGDGSKIAKIAP